MRTQRHKIRLKLRVAASTCVCLVALGCKPSTTTSPAPTPTAAETTPESTESGRVPEEAEITTVPLTSAELKGIWYATRGELGVIVRFVGRQSREPGVRGVLGGDCQVMLKGSSISSHVQYTDDPQSGSVNITVDLVNAASQEPFTKKIGFVERGDDGRLYFTLNADAEQDRYPPADRLALTFIADRDEIEPSDLDTLRAAMTNPASNASEN